MDGFQALVVKASCDGESEIRGVDADDHIRALLKQEAHQLLAQTQQFRQVSEHFGDTHHRELFHGKQAGETGCGHFFAADADKTGIGITGLQ